MKRAKWTKGEILHVQVMIMYCELRSIIHFIVYSGDKYFLKGKKICVLFSAFCILSLFFLIYYLEKVKCLKEYLLRKENNNSMDNVKVTLRKR